jgi:hypothetical protein
VVLGVTTNAWCVGRAAPRNRTQAKYRNTRLQRNGVLFFLSTTAAVNVNVIRPLLARLSPLSCIIRERATSIGNLLK